jgi:hypothetical protein
MVLPRPLPKNTGYDELCKFLEQKFARGEEVRFVKPSEFHSFVLRYHSASNGTGEVIVMLHNTSKKRTYKMGGLAFYCHVQKDIGLVEVADTLSPTQWLLSGIDGTTNLDRLCLAWSKNGELIPDLKTDNGKALKAILDEMNQVVKITPSWDEAAQAAELIDQGLVKFGTFLEDLRQRSGLPLKEQGD